MNLEIFRLCVYFLFVVIVFVTLCMQFKYDMQMLQQNSYRNERYWRWIKMSDDTSDMRRLVVMATIAMVCAFNYALVQLVVSLILIIQICVLSRKKYKKPLVFTNRVIRLYSGCIIAALAIALGSALVGGTSVAGIVMLVITAVSYLFVMAVNYALKPVEKAINDSYVKDAKNRLATMPEMKVIGITGSYGKTSTKHYLFRILSEQYNVLMTPGSYNTPMGVVRTVREMLESYHEIFIAEMGAKNIGDIKEICDIVSPTIGIVTAVGAQHLESFKTIENVQRTKFELVDALPADGFAVLNNDFEYVANRSVENVRSYRYGINNTDKSDYIVGDVKYSNAGTTFELKCVADDSSISFATKLVGESNISNLMAAVIVALKLNIPVPKIQYAVSKIEQVEHRLSMKHTASGLTIIDDAFNSNPDGSRMALDVLKKMEGGKRIIITPGMIELGEKQVEYNHIFGQRIASSVDVAIIVGQYNRDSITSGIDEAKNDNNTPETHIVDTFAEAQALLMSIAQRGDTVLYENDLPDTFK